MRRDMWIVIKVSEESELEIRNLWECDVMITSAIKMIIATTMERDALKRCPASYGEQQQRR